VTWRVSRSLEAEPMSRERVLRRYERGRSHHQIGLFVVYLLTLIALGWGWAVGELWKWDAQTPLPGAELLVLAPFVLGQMLAWSIYYDAERASQRAAQRLLAAQTQAAGWLELDRPRSAALSLLGGRSSYVLFQLRQKLGLVFLPVVLLLIQKELLRLSPETA